MLLSHDSSQPHKSSAQFVDELIQSTEGADTKKGNV